MTAEEDEELFQTLKGEPVIFTESQGGEAVDMVDEGWHPSKFTGWDVRRNVTVEYKGEEKVVDKIKLWFETDDGARVPRTVNYTWGPRSNAKKLIAGMLGRDVNDRFNLDLQDILGTKCEILITHNPVGEYTYINIEKARPLNVKKG